MSKMALDRPSDFPEGRNFTLKSKLFEKLQLSLVPSRKSGTTMVWKQKSKKANRSKQIEAKMQCIQAKSSKNARISKKLTLHRN